MSDVDQPMAVRFVAVRCAFNNVRAKGGVSTLALLRGQTHPVTTLGKDGDFSWAGPFSASL